jgi:hypothetical protein
MFSKSKQIWIVLSLSVLALGLMAFSPFVARAAPTWDGQGGPNGRGGNGQGGGMVGSGYGQGAGMGLGVAGQTCTGTGTCTSTALTPLSAAEEQALQDAILEEYGALNLYQAVIDQFGNVYPFSQIVRAEQQHVNALVRQATKYGVEAPANPDLSSPVSFTTTAEACQAGVEAEKADAALYDDLKAVTTHSDLTSVYTRLQNISLNTHLPVFEACN